MMTCLSLLDRRSKIGVSETMPGWAWNDASSSFLLRGVEFGVYGNGAEELGLGKMVYCMVLVRWASGVFWGAAFSERIPQITYMTCSTLDHHSLQDVD